jgi:UDP-GlcNAc3NAcA epimerase
MKILSVVGARPQFIKAAAITRCIGQVNKEAGQKKICEVLVHTGQHYDENMSKVFFEELDIREPDHNLGVGSASHGAQTGRILEKIEEVLEQERPDVVLIYGDTNSTLGGALAAVKLHIPVAHVEAGLRSYNRRMPEEINRVVADHVSDILFCPTEAAVENLRREGISKGVHKVGDVMYDVALYYAEKAASHAGKLASLGLAPKRYALVTIHRAENTDDTSRLLSIFQSLNRIAESGLECVVPLHPRTRQSIATLDLGLHVGVRLLTPVSYLDMIVLERNAKVIVTDSGGVQKEAYFYKVPCVTLRDETEWTETVESGWNVLVGADTDKVVEAVLHGREPSCWFHRYGDGGAAGRMLDVLISLPPRHSSDTSVLPG